MGDIVVDVFENASCHTRISVILGRSSCSKLSLSLPDRVYTFLVFAINLFLWLGRYISPEVVPFIFISVYLCLETQKMWMKELLNMTEFTNKENNSTFCLL